MTELEQTLSEALTYARVPELPAELSDNIESWTKAIVLVRKASNLTNYAIARNDGSGNPVIIKDFGASFIVREIISIHPYSFISRQYQPNLRSKEDIQAYLINHGEDEATVKQLLSSKNKNGRAKSEAKAKEDNAAIKALVMKYTIADENAMKEALDSAVKTAHPELEEEQLFEEA